MKPPTDRSTYNAICECGASVWSYERETICPKCKRTLVFEWGEPAAPPPESEQRP